MYFIFSVSVLIITVGKVGGQVRYIFFEPVLAGFSYKKDLFGEDIYVFSCTSWAAQHLFSSGICVCKKT